MSRVKLLKLNWAQLNKRKTVAQAAAAEENLQQKSQNSWKFARNMENVKRGW